MCGITENVVLRLFIELVGNNSCSRDVIHNRYLGFLIEALRCQRDPAVDETNCCGNLFLVDQFLGYLYATFVLRFIVTLNNLKLTADYATCLVNFVHSELHPVAHAYSHRRRTTCKGPWNSNLDGLCCMCHTAKTNGQNWLGYTRWTFYKLALHGVSVIKMFVNHWKKWQTFENLLACDFP